MGAFENAIREGETFDSLLELYRESLDRIAALESQLDRDTECIREVQDELNRVYELRDDLRAQLVDRDAEIERLRADLVWAIDARSIPPEWGMPGRILKHTVDGEIQWAEWDGTPDSICRAVREARDGTH